MPSYKHTDDERKTLRESDKHYPTCSCNTCKRADVIRDKSAHITLES